MFHLLNMLHVAVNGHLLLENCSFVLASISLPSTAAMFILKSHSSLLASLSQAEWARDGGTL